MRVGLRHVGRHQNGSIAAAQRAVGVARLADPFVRTTAADEQPSFGWVLKEAAHAAENYAWTLHSFLPYAPNRMRIILKDAASQALKMR